MPVLKLQLHGLSALPITIVDQQSSVRDLTHSLIQIMSNYSVPTPSTFSRSNQREGTSDAALLKDLEQPYDYDPQRLDLDRISAIQGTIKKIERVVPISTKAVSKRRTLFAWTIGTSAVSANSVGLDNSGATSNVFRDVSIHIDEVLQDVAGT